MSKGVSTVSGSTVKFITLAEAGVRLSVSKDTIRRRVDDGLLPAYRIIGSRGVRVKAEDVDRMMIPMDPNGFSTSI